MSSFNKINTLIWGYISQAINLGVGLIAFPFVARELHGFALSFWFILLALNTFVTMMDLGFLPTLSRNLTYVLSGVSELRHQGISNQALVKGNNSELLVSTGYVAKKIYFILSVVSLVVIFLFGFLYLYHLCSDYQDFKLYFLVWSIFGAVSCLNLYFSYYSVLLLGFKKNAECYQVIILMRLCFLLSLIVFFSYFRQGVMSIAYAQIAAVFISRTFLIYLITKEKSVNELLTQIKKTAWSSDKFSILQIVSPNAIKTGIVSIGGFLITRAGIFLAPYALGTEVSIRFGLAQQVFTVLSGVSMVAFGAISNHLSEAWAKNDFDLLRREISIASMISWLIFSFGVLVLFFFGEAVLRVLDLNVKMALLNTPELLFFAVIAFLEMNHSNFASVIMSQNEVPFVKASLFSGISIVLLSILFSQLFEIGVYAILLPTFLVQACYNNWKWPNVVSRRLHLGLGQMFNYFIHAMTFKFRH